MGSAFISWRVWQLREVQYRDGCEGRKSGHAGSTHPPYGILAFRHWPVDSVWGCSVSILIFIIFNALTLGPTSFLYIPLSCLSPTAFLPSCIPTTVSPRDPSMPPTTISSIQTIPSWISSLPSCLVQPPSWPHLDPSKLLTPEKMNLETITPITPHSVCSHRSIAPGPQVPSLGLRIAPRILPLCNASPDLIPLVASAPMLPFEPDLPHDFMFCRSLLQTCSSLSPPCQDLF